MFIENTQIYYLENFLTDEELLFLDEKASRFVPVKVDGDEPRWATNSDRVMDILEPGDETRILRYLNLRMGELAKDVYKFDDNMVSQGIGSFHMLYPPFSMQEHWDGTTVGVHYGIVIYVSDPSDYEGGEIYYCNKNISIKPSRGSIVLHPATEEYEHGVKQVTGGMRVAMSSFVQEKDRIGGPGNNGYS